MGCTFKCNKCEFTVRVSEQYALDVYQKDHNILCNGVLESVWKDYGKMTKEQIENQIKKTSFKYGVIQGEK